MLVQDSCWIDSNTHEEEGNTKAKEEYNWPCEIAVVHNTAIDLSYWVEYHPCLCMDMREVNPEFYGQFRTKVST